MTKKGRRKKAEKADQNDVQKLPADNTAIFRNVLILVQDDPAYKG